MPLLPCSCYDTALSDQHEMDGLSDGQAFNHKRFIKEDNQMQLR